MSYLPFTQNGYNNLTLGAVIACNVPWESLHVWYKLRLFALSSSAADPTTECNGLTGDFALERS